MGSDQVYWTHTCISLAPPATPSSYAHHFCSSHSPQSPPSTRVSAAQYRQGLLSSQTCPVSFAPLCHVSCCPLAPFSFLIPGITRPSRTPTCPLVSDFFSPWGSERVCDSLLPTGVQKNFGVRALWQRFPASCKDNMKELSPLLPLYFVVAGGTSWNAYSR